MSPLSLVFVLGLLASSNAELFALVDATPNTPGLTTSFRLVTIDLKTGARVPVSVNGTEIKYTPGCSSVDRKNSVLYFIGQHVVYTSEVTLVGVSLKTGAVVSTVAIPGADPAAGEIFMWGLAFASDLGNSGKAVVSMTTAAGSHVVGTMDPSTGEWKIMATVERPTVGGVQPSSSVYIPGRQTYIFQLGVNHAITQFAYDFKTGVLRNATGPQITDFVFNPKDGMVWGHGVVPGPNGTYWVRTVEKMDSSTLVVEQFASGLNVLTIDGGGSVTLDVDAQIMYWPTALYKDAGKPASPFYLAQMSMVDGSVVSDSVALCPVWKCPECGNSTCPHTLDFATVGSGVVSV